MTLSLGGRYALSYYTLALKNLSYIAHLWKSPMGEPRCRMSPGGLMASTCLGHLCYRVFWEDHVTQNNLELMRTLDDSWNAQDWDTFEKRHSKDTTVFWPGQAEPTRGRDNHKAESVEFFKTFPDNHLINHPYRVEIAQGEWTCTVADFTGTMRGPMKGSDGKLIAPTNKKFHIEFCTVAHWKNGEIVEEKLFYDLVGLLKQIGVT